MTKEQLKEYCLAEFENIDDVLLELFSIIEPSKLEYSTAELAAIATFIHNFYSGTENILKRILLSREKEIKETPTWHKDLLKMSFDMKIISQDLYNELSDYLSFRHFFVHAYSFTLKWESLKPLVENIKNVLTEFRMSVSSLL